MHSVGNTFIYAGEDDEIESTVEGKCCKVCDDSWVIAVNPDNTANKGQTVVLTCEINAEGVYKKDIQWYKDGEPITEGVSKNKYVTYHIFLHE